MEDVIKLLWLNKILRWWKAKFTDPHIHGSVEENKTVLRDIDPPGVRIPHAFFAEKSDNKGQR